MVSKMRLRSGARAKEGRVRVDLRKEGRKQEEGGHENGTSGSLTQKRDDAANRQSNGDFGGDILRSNNRDWKRQYYTLEKFKGVLHYDHDSDGALTMLSRFQREKQCRYRRDQSEA